MTFGLLTPLALGLAALLAGPLLAHLARRRPTNRVDFGAMMLLRRVQKRLKRRRRVQDLWLLLLRLLLLALVIAAVSRPELRWPAADVVQDSGPVVVVLDNSLSMDQRDDGSSLLSRARDGAVELLRGLPSGARVGLVTAGGRATRLSPELIADPGAVAAQVAEIQQSSGATDLAGALGEARRLLQGAGGTVVVFSDEAGPTAVPAAEAELKLMGEQGVALRPIRLRPQVVANALVADARYGEGLEGGSVRLTVQNRGEIDLEMPLVVQLPDGVEITAFVEVPAGGQAEETVTVPRVAEGGVALARLEDPHLPADNVFAFHMPRVGASRVLVVDGDPGPTPTASEVYFLERALAPWGTAGAVRGGVLPDVTSSAGVPELDPELHRVIFVANLSDPAPLAARLTDFVRRGGGLVLALGDNVTPDLYNGALAALLPARLKRPQSLVARGEDGVATELPDTSLALFRPFSRGGRGSFARTRWRQLYGLEPYEDSEEVRTLLRTEGGLPLLIERKVGQGHVLLLTGTMDLGWGDFPLQSAFMPFVQRLVTYLGGEAGGGGERMSAKVGEGVAVPLPDGVIEATVEGPNGPVPARLRAGEVLFEPSAPGAYLVETPGAPPLAWVAVNTDPAESDVRPGPSLVETAARIDPERYQRREELAPWLLAGALLVALAQAALALGLALKQDAPEVAAAEPDPEEHRRAG